MDKISINLLPQEVLIQEKDRLKRSILFRISLTFLFFVIVIAAVTFALRVVQTEDLKNTNAQLASAEGRVTNLKEQESLVLYLEQRLDNIDTLQRQETQPVQAYLSMTKLIPPSVDIAAFTVDKSKDIIISAKAADTASIKIFFDNLTNPVANQGKINKVKIDSLSRASDGSYRMDLTVTLK